MARHEQAIIQQRSESQIGQDLDKAEQKTGRSGGLTQDERKRLNMPEHSSTRNTAIENALKRSGA